MKAFIVKYALTEGIQEVDAEYCSEENQEMIKYRIFGGYCNIYCHKENGDWCKTKEAAVKVAEKMRIKRIESLKKQIGKLEKMRFE